ncbi:MAG: hypothetical protein GY820_00615 [Gammaproteobacteria bacterium]|nr:hypothetical protein [Gammaproteobacteria bacterium]
MWVRRYEAIIFNDIVQFVELLSSFLGGPALLSGRGVKDHAGPAPGPANREVKNYASYGIVRV